MTTEAIVNSANVNVEVGPGCDYAVYQAVGFDLKSKYIIHTIRCGD